MEGGLCVSGFGIYAMKQQGDVQRHTLVEVEAEAEVEEAAGADAGVAAGTAGVAEDEEATCFLGGLASLSDFAGDGGVSLTGAGGDGAGVDLGSLAGAGTAGVRGGLDVSLVVAVVTVTVVTVAAAAVGWGGLVTSIGWAAVGLRGEEGADAGAVGGGGGGREGTAGAGAGARAGTTLTYTYNENEVSSQ